MNGNRSRLYAAWLQNRRMDDPRWRETYARLTETIAVAGEHPVIRTAARELADAVRTMLGIRPRIARASEPERGVLLTVSPNVEAKRPAGDGIAGGRIGEEGYLIKCEGQGSGERLFIIGGSERGVLYGVYHLIRMMAMGLPLKRREIAENPANGLRMLNHWDNADGSIERGYAGNSIFFRNGKIVGKLGRIRDYARLLASVGINAIAINNVNVHETESRLITEEKLPQVARLARLFGEYGIRLFLSVNFAAPVQIGGLSTADPLDEEVREWWKSTAANVYRHIPDFGGFVVKADSEFRPGPFTYGRDHADGANMLGEALEPFGGLVIWRCFVYNCRQDWRDRSTDRAKAAYDHFQPLDGRFRENVLLQVKNGPMDFQVREPVSPLLGAMPQTNLLLELQITQEYTGQQKHLCYLVPQWKEVLDFDTFVRGPGSTVKKIIRGALFGARHGGIAAVANVGDDDNWTGHPLAQANLYGYGRLAWNPELKAEEIAQEWIVLTFGRGRQVLETVGWMLQNSWRIYESYTAPLGVGWMVKPHTHYGPDVDGYEYSHWGTYHYADHSGIGVDRTVATGTGFTAQYCEPNASRYERIETCPDELLLFFHHVNYLHHLKSGKTVIQHIYDSHFEGAEEAGKLLRMWQSLKGKIDPEWFGQVLDKLREQAEHAREWRDVINSYFYRKSGIPDRKGRKIY